MTTITVGTPVAQELARLLTDMMRGQLACSASFSEACRDDLVRFLDAVGETDAARHIETHARDEIRISDCPEDDPWANVPRLS